MSANRLDCHDRFLVSCSLQFCCKGGIFFTDNSSDSTGPLIAFNRDIHLLCEMPQYIYISGILTFYVISVFLKMSAILKIVLLIVMGTGYLIVMEYTHVALFEKMDVQLV